MAFSLIIDDTSLLLLLLIIGLLAVGIFVGKSYQPLVHPLILARQSDVAPVRRKGQSSVYRNANSPAGFEMPTQPRRAIVTVADVLAKGSAAPEWKSSHRRTVYDEKSCSNDDIRLGARGFGQGLAKMAGVEQLRSLAVAVCVEVDSVESLKVILSGDVQANAAVNRFAPLVIAPAHLKSGHPPTSLPETQSSGNSLHAVFTTSAVVKRASQMPIVDGKTILVVATENEAQEARSIVTDHRIVAFQDIVSQAGALSVADEEKPAGNSQADPREAGKTIQSVFWTGHSGWVPVSNTSLIAGLTAQLGFFPADQQPSQKDFIYVEQAPHIESASLRLGAAATPAGLVLALLALYTNASLAADTLTSSYSDWNPAPSQEFSEAQPTILFASPAGASTLAACLCSFLRRSPFCRLAAHTKLSALRHGTFSNQGWWDRLLFEKVRQQASCQRLRSLVILSEGPTVGQSLLDILRAQLGCSVRLAYLPAQPLRLFDDSLEAGVDADSGFSANAKYALTTTPIAVTHSLDLQAFATHPHDGTQQVPAHVGPPNVTAAIKLVETKMVKEKGLSVAGLRAENDAGRADDPFGEIFVCGSCLAGTTSSLQWAATNDIGTFRTNGTLVVVLDKEHSPEVDVPTLSSEYPSSRRTSRIGAGGAPTRLLPILTQVLMITVCLFGLMADSAQASLFSSPSSEKQLTRRAASSINTTFVDLALMSVMGAQRASWEQGVAQSAILEYYGGSWSAFSGRQPPPYVPSSGGGGRGGLPPQLLAMATAAVNSQNALGELCSRVTGDETAMEGSALDPASCGEAVLIAAFANGEISSTGQISSGRYSTAAQRQLDFLLNRAPKTPAGAISMRNVGESYWSDGVYMGPPFLAQYGLMTNNQTLLQMAYDEVRLYRDSLRINTGDALGLFAHIVNATSADAPGQDPGAWLTGNAWSAGGMVRVLASIAQNPTARLQMSSQMTDLINWTNELITYSFNFLEPNPPQLLHNYIDNSSTFLDAGGSAMMAYATYRIASIVGDQPFASQLEKADLVYQAVQNQMGADGQLIEGSQVVNPLTFTSPSQSSPESMAFLVLMAAARRDHASGNVTSTDGPRGGSNANSAADQQLVSISVLALLSVATALFASLL